MNLNLTLIGQIGTFLVLWWFTHKYIWPLFSKVAEARRQKIAEGLSMADKAKHSIAEAQEEGNRNRRPRAETGRTIGRGCA